MSEIQHIADTWTLEDYRRDYAAALAQDRLIAAKTILRLAGIAGYSEWVKEQKELMGWENE